MNCDLERLRVGPVEVAFRAVGEGRPLLMFHGGEGDHQIYDKVQDALPAGIRSISFDQRDCGATTFDTPNPYDLLDVVQDGVRLIDALGYDKVDVLGNSIGGVMAQLMAVLWADRVAHLVLGFTWPADQRLPQLNPAGMAKRAEYVSMGEAGVPLMAALSTSDAYVRDHPEIVPDLKSLRTETSPEARQRRQAAFASPPLVDPSAIRQDTLIIGGGEDRIVPAAITKTLSQRIGRSTYAVVSEAGHLAARQYPDRIAQLVAPFLQR